MIADPRHQTDSREDKDIPVAFDEEVGRSDLGLDLCGEADSEALIDVVGVAVSAAQASPTAPRPHVVIVTDAWGEHWGERAIATRLLAGALALRARVSIVSLEDRSDPGTRQAKLRYDGLFPVHSVAAPPAPPAKQQRSELIRAALMRQPSGMMPDIAVRQALVDTGRPSTAAVLATHDLRPDVVVLAGPATFWMGAALPVGPHRPRVVLLPLSGNDVMLSSPAFRPLALMVDAIGAFSDGELRQLTSLVGDDRAASVHRLHIALPVNRLAATAGMAGLSPFGRYVLVISAFDEDPASASCPPHEYFREMLGDVAVAEVRRTTWVVTAPGKRFDIPWTPSRMNLWRLMARAEAMVDIRPQGPLGRDAIETLRFGTPVVVPDGSVAAEHAAASNGGLWYRNHGEMMACLSTLLNNPELSEGLGASGQSWAEHYHGDTDTFVEAAIGLVLGDSAGREELAAS